jgi:hypothetical protein
VNASGRLTPPASTGVLRVPETGLTIVSLGYFANADRDLQVAREPAAPGPFQVVDDQVAGSLAGAADSTIKLSARDLGIRPDRFYTVIVGYRCVDDGGLAGANIGIVRGGALPPLEDPVYTGTPGPDDPQLYAGPADGYCLRWVSNGFGLPPEPNGGSNFLHLVDDEDEWLSFRAYHTGGAGRIWLDNAYIFDGRWVEQWLAAEQLEPFPNPRPAQLHAIPDAPSGPFAPGGTNGPGYGLDNGALVEEETQQAPDADAALDTLLYIDNLWFWPEGQTRRVLCFARTTRPDATGYLALATGAEVDSDVLVRGTPAETVEVRGRSYQLIDLGHFRTKDPDADHSTVTIRAFLPTGAPADAAIRIEDVWTIPEGTEIAESYTGAASAATQVGPTKLLQLAPQSYMAEDFALDPSGLCDAGGVWDDLSARVRALEVERGRQFELDRIEAGTATVRLANRDGLLDPTNPASPYYVDPDVEGSGLRPGRLVRIQADYGASGPDADRVFTGFIERVRIVRRGRRDSECVLELADALALLARAQVPTMRGQPPGSSGTNSPGFGKTVESYYAPQHVDARIRAGLADGNWPPCLAEIAAGNVQMQGLVYPPGTAIAEVIADAVEAEFPGRSLAFVAGDGRFRFLGRNYLTGASAKAVLGDAAWIGDHPDDIPIRDGDFEISDGVEHVYNDVKVYPSRWDASRLASTRALDAASIAKHGPRPLAFEIPILAGDDGTSALEECARIARFLVATFAWPVPRIANVVLSALMRDDVRALIYTLDIGDLLEVHVTNPGGGAVDGVYVVQGLHHHAAASDNFAGWTCRLELAPYAFWADAV